MSKPSANGAGHGEAPPNDADTQGAIITGVCAMLIVLDTAMVAFRLWARRLRKVSLWWDDWLIILALVIAWVGVIQCWTMTSYSLSQNGMTAIPLDDLVTMTKIFLAWVLTYPILNFTVRTSLLLFYLRMFGLRMKAFRWMWIANMTFAGLVCLAMIIQPLVLCMPLSGYWDGTCHNTDLPSTIVINVANTFSDLGILVLPIPTVWSLQMARQKKIALSGVFALGSVGVIISAARTPILVSDLESIDTTFIETAPLVISFAEPSIGIICACLPTMRPFIQKLSSGFRSTFGSHPGVSSHDFAKSAGNRSSTPRQGQVNGDLSSGLPQHHGHHGSWTRLGTSSTVAASDDYSGPFYPLESVHVEKPVDARCRTVELREFDSQKPS